MRRFASRETFKNLSSRIWTFDSRGRGGGPPQGGNSVLIKCVAAEYNAGRANAQAGHKLGDVGKYTTHTAGVSYSDRVLKYFHQLAGGQAPSG